MNTTPSLLSSFTFLPDKEGRTSQWPFTQNEECLFGTRGDGNESRNLCSGGNEPRPSLACQRHSLSLTFQSFKIGVRKARKGITLLAFLLAFG